MKPLEPKAIENESFRIIEETLVERGLMDVIDPDILPVVMRVIHATADFDYAETFRCTEHVVRYAADLLLQDPVIITDTQMALAGINKQALKRLQIEAVCFMSDTQVAEEARAEGITRAWVSMRKAAHTYAGQKTIFVIGNAPTALLSLHELYQHEHFCPDLIIGVPVGFVNVVESKALFLSSEIPHIIAEGRKGGSTVAAAVMNALLYQASPRP